jgi:hypothetical protein
MVLVELQNSGRSCSGTGLVLLDYCVGDDLCWSGKSLESTSIYQQYFH